jgi:hypothetical protein
VVSGGGSPAVEANRISGLDGTGMIIGADTSPRLIANGVCGNGTNLRVADTATPTIDADNEICADGSVE